MNRSPTQIAALQHGEPVRLTPPEIGTACVVLRADLYDRIQAALDDSLNMEQVGALVEHSMREDDERDPLLDSYEKYRR